MKKVITAGLSFAMAASMLAGCSSKPAENSDSGDKRVLKFDSFSGGNGEEVLLINLMRRANISLKSSPVNKANKDCVYIEKYIDAHFKEDITLDTLSELTFLNKYHIVHAFKQYKGISPINYMIQKRIQEAKVLLSTTNLQISEISIIIGFTSQSYFAQAFKKATGISPIQFRKNHSEQ